MYYVNSAIRINKSANNNSRYSSLIFWGAVFFVLLLARDAYSVGVNKNIFILITCLCAVTMKTDQLIYLFCFLFPLYVGLPGNYMTIILIGRLLFSMNKIRPKLSSFILTVFACVFLFCQNVVLGYTGVVPMVFVAGVVLVLFLFSFKDQLNVIQMTMMYSAGVAALGFIMLISTLRVFSFQDLISVSFRLGSSNVDYVGETIMNVSVDPNFYGTFSISAITTAVPIIFRARTKLFEKTMLCCFSAVSLVVSLIGLSRAFFLAFIAWLILYMLSQKNIKHAIVTVIAICFVTIIIITVMPEVLDAVLTRFKDSDMAGGNGRLDGLNVYFNKWKETLGTIMFGIGLYNCSVHCMPLQFLFGGGVVLFTLTFALSISYKSNVRNNHCLFDGLPLLMTFVMMCSVPPAGLINFMFPIIYVGLLMKYQQYLKA